MFFNTGCLKFRKRFLAGRNNKNREYDVGLSLTRCVFLMFKHVNWRGKAVSPTLPAGGGGEGPKIEPNIFEPVWTQWFSTFNEFKQNIYIFFYLQFLLFKNKVLRLGS